MGRFLNLLKSWKRGKGGNEGFYFIYILVPQFWVLMSVSTTGVKKVRKALDGSETLREASLLVKKAAVLWVRLPLTCLLSNQHARLVFRGVCSFEKVS